MRLAPVALGLACVALFVACGSSPRTEREPARESDKYDVAAGGEEERRAESQGWLDWVTREKAKGDWRDLEIYPSRTTTTARCDAILQVVQVVDGTHTLVVFKEDRFLLEASLGPVEVGGSYRLNGLFAPAGRQKYTDVNGTTVSIHAVRFISRVPQSGQPIDTTPEAIDLRTSKPVTAPKAEAPVDPVPPK